MGSAIRTGADALVAVLAEHGVDTVFGVPGTQNIPLFDALRRHQIRTVLATSETMAGFMAIGWDRAKGRPGVFVGIPGPGFAFALPALAEAALDSSAVLFITGDRVSRGRLFDHQMIDQDAISEALCGACFRVSDTAQLVATAHRAVAEATGAGGRPIVLQVASSALNGDYPAVEPGVSGDRAEPELRLPDDLLERLRRCEKPLVLAGAGALGWSEQTAAFVSSLDALLITSPAARGIIPENSWRAIPVDLLCDDAAGLNRLIAESDLVIALGSRFSHNGTGGFGLRIPEDCLVQVHEDAAVLSANYPAQWTFAATVGAFLTEVATLMSNELRPSGGRWSREDADRWRSEILTREPDAAREPSWPAGAVGCGALFDELRSVLPDDAMLVTDTGMHQIVSRKYFEVRAPRGLIVPTDFQSMGFGVPAALGAALAAPERRVVALVGDGTLQMTLAELGTIARERIPLVVIVFSDGWLGQIRMQQIEWGGEECETRLADIDLEHIASAFGIHYQRCERSIRTELERALASGEPALLEVVVADPPRLADLKASLRRKQRVKDILGPRATNLLKKIAGRG